MSGAERPRRIVVEPLERSVLAGVPVQDAEHGEHRLSVDVGVLPVFSDERPLQGLAGFLDWRSSGMLSDLLRGGVCEGRHQEATLLPGRHNLPIRRLVLVGLGPLAQFDRDRAVEAAGRMVEIARGLLPADVLVAMPGRLPERRAHEVVFRGLVDAIRAAESPLEPMEAAAASGEGPQRQVDEAAEPDLACCWWVVAESRHVARLRRLLQGPPRPAGPE